jgi:crotonobetainyl-CoA:carnitine CoA-transferase CaiB-like acyl-CoA transferase
VNGADDGLIGPAPVAVGEDRAAGPLAGVRVLDLATTFAGPYCTQMLADLGADVLKIEAPGGDVTRHLGASRVPGMGSVYAACNRNKASVLLDLKDPADAVTLRGLIGAADCLVHNLRAGAAARLGIDADTALGLNPRLVHAVITGFGSGGPLAGRPAYDDVIQARSGLAWLQGLSAGEPQYVASPVADKVAGLFAVQAVVAALYDRERTGRGQAVEVPMFEALVGFTLMEQWGGRAFVPATGPTGYARIRSPHRKPYRTADGMLSVVVYHDGHWRRFLEAVGHGHLLSDERFRTTEARNHHIDELYVVLEGLLAERTTAEWLELLERIDVPAVPVQDLDALFDDEHLAEVDFFQEVPGAAGETYLAARPALRFGRTPLADPRDLPGPDRLGGGEATMSRWLDANRD